MDRRKLILRRFGPMTFGLGYYDGGTWVDHAQPATQRAVPEGDGSLDVVHDWLSCCLDATDGLAVLPVRRVSQAPVRSEVVAHGG